MAEPEPLKIDDAVAGFIRKILRLESFFPEFGPEHLVKLFPRSGLFRYPPGFRLISQGDEGRDLFALYEGSVEIRQSFGSASATLTTLGPGALIGEIALLEKAPRSADAVCMADSAVYRIAFVDLDYILLNNLALAGHLRGLAASRRG